LNNVAVIWPPLMVGIDDEGFICVELCWLGLVIGVGTVKVDE